MLYCPNGHQGLSDERFCRTCGEPLAARCAAGHTVAVGDGFCRACGAPVLVDPPTSASAPTTAFATGPMAGPPAAPYPGAPPAAPYSVTPPDGGPRPNTASYAGLPPNAPPPGPLPADRRRRRTVAIVVASLAGLVAVAAIALIASGALLTTTHRSATVPAPVPGTSFKATPTVVSPTTTTQPVSTTVAPTTVSTPPAGTAAMAAMSGYIGESAAVRPSVQSSIDGLDSCTLSTSNAVATMQQAITTRQNVLTGLGNLPLTGLAGGEQLVVTLSRALQDSITADQDYVTWMAEFPSGYPCGTDPNQNSQYNAAQAASQQATADKGAFVALWNPVAPTYGRQTYTSSDF